MHAFDPFHPDPDAAARFTLSIGDHPLWPLTVVAFDGSEAISTLFEFNLTIAVPPGSVELRQLLSQPAQLTIDDQACGRTTRYHGVIRQCQQQRATAHYLLCRLQLVPQLALLDIAASFAVHTVEQNLPELVAAQLQRVYPSSDGFALRLRQRYRPRSLLCQYQETTFAFLSRWLEKEGIYYFFSDEQGQLTLIDDQSLQPETARHLRYHDTDAGILTSTAIDCVDLFDCSYGQLPRAVVLHEHNHRKAAVPLTARAVVDACGYDELVLHGENFRDQAEGDRYAQIRADELRCQAMRYTGRSTATGLRSGYPIEIAGHFDPFCNGRYLVTAVRHHGRQAGVLTAAKGASEGGLDTGAIGYRCEFDAIPATVQFRPRRQTPRPVVAGLITATVAADPDAGSTSPLDEYGQYRVHPAFCGDSTSATIPLRMMTPYAGSDHGMHFPLQAGTEVALSFIGGDPDQPLIINAVPNSEHPSVVDTANRQQNTIASRSGNLVQLNDTMSSPSIWLRAPGDQAALGLRAASASESGGFFSFSNGSYDQWWNGIHNRIGFGVDNDVSWSTVNQTRFGLSNQLQVGASTRISVADSTQLQLDPFERAPLKSTTISDLETTQLMTRSSTSAVLGRYTISAGLNPHNRANKVRPLLAALRAAKKMIGAKVTLLQLFGMAGAGAINRSLGAAEDRQKSGFFDHWTRTLAGIGIESALDAGFMTLLRRYLDRLQTQQRQSQQGLTCHFSLTQEGAALSASKHHDNEKKQVAKLELDRDKGFTVQAFCCHDDADEHSFFDEDSGLVVVPPSACDDMARISGIDGSLLGEANRYIYWGSGNAVLRIGDSTREIGDMRAVQLALTPDSNHCDLLHARTRAVVLMDRCILIQSGENCLIGMDDHSMRGVVDGETVFRSSRELFQLF